MLNETNLPLIQTARKSVSGTVQQSTVVRMETSLQDDMRGPSNDFNEAGQFKHKDDCTKGGEHNLRPQRIGPLLPLKVKTLSPLQIWVPESPHDTRGLLER